MFVHLIKNGSCLIDFIYHCCCRQHSPVMVAVLHPWHRHMAGSQVSLLLCPNSAGIATSATSPQCHHPQGAPPSQRSTRLSRAGRASPAVPWFPSSSMVPTHNHCRLVVSKSSGWAGGGCFQGNTEAGDLSPCPCHSCMSTGAEAELGSWHCLCFPSPCARCPQCPCCGTEGHTSASGLEPLQNTGTTGQQRSGHHWGAQPLQDMCPV